MAQRSVFCGQYSDPEYSDFDSEESDFDPADFVPSLPPTDQITADLSITTDLPPKPQLVKDVNIILDMMASLGLTVASFMDALSWGSTVCTQDAGIRNARTRFLASPELPSILRRWHKPPRPPQSRDARPAGAAAVMAQFALEISLEILEEELELAANIFESPVGDDIKEEHLTGFSFSKTVKQVKEVAPSLWSTLFRLARTPSQQIRSPNKNPANTILIIIAIFSYTRTHNCGRLQKLFAIYFKFRGLSAKGFDTLHAIGLTMSNKWTGDAVERISEEAMVAMKSFMDRFPWLMSYDNALLTFRVFAQRVDKKTLHGSGTAGTVYIKRSARPLPGEINRMLQEFRRDGMKKPLTGAEIFKISMLADTRRVPHILYLILSYLFDSPDFDFSTYSGHDHPLLQKPNGIRPLPFGKDHITLQYLLGTLDIPEASYEDNARLIIEWLKQLNFRRPEAQQKLGLEQIMACVGDQLTVDRLRNLFRFRAEDDNSFERLDWLVVPPGWLHIQMAFANSLHKQHLGTSKGRGLSAAFDVMNRRGLQSSATQGPFFHDLSETLHIIAEAQIREVWLEVGKVQNLKDLRTKTPVELFSLAEKIVAEHASSAALVQMNRKPRPDELKAQSIMFLRDVIPFILLRSAVRHGDVGIMEDMIPHLLFRFIGGKNTNYTTEMFELLQGLHREWPPELCEFIRDNCWVINNTGRATGFMPVDEAQEMNIKDIKVTYRSEGPNIDWEYLKKLHPAIHVIRAVNDHMEYEFKTKVRGHKHTVPKKELDLQELQKWYRASDVHTFEPGRKIKYQRDQPTDTVSQGGIALQTGETRANWIETRTVERATTQNWDPVVDSDSDD
ncbi:hypothetical protein B0H16DRAFT_1740112 [Mycena metata]|uniref:DUF6589 domain-containing protein n=1 Tax=Mycena metata TaxID=1033252 RepID=A0AAD7HE40_9AGAR|nr:hypothetical protein B0H16DRAFT_1740112 [Mycena metata]